MRSRLLFAVQLVLIFSAAGTSLFAQQRPPGISSKAKHFEGHWYEFRIDRDGYTWRQALKLAEEAGGHLACIETKEEKAFITKLIENNAKTRFWLGGYRAKDGWWWINGEKFSSQFKIGSNTNTNLRMMLGDKSSGRKFLGHSEYLKYDALVIEFTPGKEPEITLPPLATKNSPPPPPPAPTKPAEPSVQPSSPVTGNQHAPDIPIKKAQTQVNGLLVMSLGNGSEAGSASPMTLTALRGDPDQSASIKFNQPVGSMMQTALEEVVKFIELKHDAWPRGREIEISFENKYNPKDGPSAAVACALLLESAISGEELDPGFAVTGDMNADGSVQPIGGVEAKVRGATNRDCTHIAVPAKNLTAIYDTILMDGIRPVLSIQVFSIDSFNEAHALALTKKPEPVEQTIKEFASIQTLYQSNPGGFLQTVRHPKVVEKLNTIVTAAPNHVSATVLLKYATGNAPKALSLQGSFSFIDENAYQIVDVIKDGKVAKVDDFNQDQVADAVALLKRTKLKLDKRTWEWVDSLIQWGELMREYQTNRPKAISNINKLVDSINMAGRMAREQREQLLENPEVMEELLE